MDSDPEGEEDTDRKRYRKVNIDAGYNKINRVGFDFPTKNSYNLME